VTQRQLNAGRDLGYRENTVIAEVDRLQSTIEEYETLVAAAAADAQAEMRQTEWGKLAEILRHEGAWTPLGSEAVLSLAREYGSFVLRNALAMAIALGIEDGKRGL